MNKDQNISGNKSTREKLAIGSLILAIGGDIIIIFILFDWFDCLAELFPILSVPVTLLVCFFGLGIFISIIFGVLGLKSKRKDLAIAGLLLSLLGLLTIVLGGLRHR